MVTFGGASDVVVPPWVETTGIASSISKLPDCWMLQEASFPDDGARIASALAEGSVRMISDGSYQPELDPSLATATWTLETMDHSGSCIGSTLTPDHDSGKNDAYRAELRFFKKINGNTLELVCDLNDHRIFSH